MIDIYTEKIDSKDWILQNDLYFNLNTSNEEMSQKEVDLIRQIDGAKLKPDKHIETKYGIGTIRNLSSGCKTLLNIVKHSDKVVNVEECGPNVLKIIFTMTMEDWKTKLDAFLRFNDADVLQDKGKVTAAIAKEFAESEFEKYRVIQDSLYESDFDKLMNDMEKNDAIH